jgi:signal transduction histidine kinase/DNA-binding response OmpR family regulator
MAMPLMQDSQVNLVVVLQLHENVMNPIMEERTGMGETGETYLVGPDKRMRSNSYLDPENRSVLLSFAAPDQGLVDTPSVNAALRGENGQMETVNYLGDPVLSAYTPVKVGGNTWALIAEMHRSEAFAPITRLQTVMAGLTLIVALLAFLYIHRFTRRLVRPLLDINEQLKMLAQGRLVEKTIVYDGQDEIAEIVHSTQQVNQGIASTIRQADAIAGGDCGKEVVLLSEQDQLGAALSAMTLRLRAIISQAGAVAEGDYTRDMRSVSERDQLGRALSNMTKQLEALAEANREAMEQQEQAMQRAEQAVKQLEAENAQKSRQDWIKSGQMQLSQQLSGQKELDMLAKNIVTFLTKYAGGKVGALYLIETQHKKPILKLTASYAYTHRREGSNEFAIGEGLVGQAALERERIVVSGLPAEYTPIRSGLGEAPPRNVALLPFSYEEELKGVIEIGAFEEFTDLQLSFLDSVATQLATGVNTAQARLKMQELLAQAQAQTEELQAQAEELQSQSEELQAQQEELRQTNEELEKRTKSLEAQQAQINQKNQELVNTQRLIETKAHELEMASKYKSEFLANMSHELRTPLNSLLILAQLLAANKEGNLTAKQIESARTIHSAGGDLLLLINDILDLSKVEAGKLELHFEETSLAAFTESLRLKFNHVAEQKRVGFAIEIAPEIPDLIMSDAQRLKQIINNLLSNAFKFTKHGQVTLSIRRPLPQEKLARSDLQRETTIAFSVIDTGIGIPQEKQRLIFEAFQQADGSTSRRYGGTGLGLSISRQLAQLFGGEIQLSSEDNKGSVFTLFVPERAALPSAEFTTPPPRFAPPKQPPAPAVPPAKPKESNPSAPISPALPPLDDDRAQLQPGDKSLLIVEDDREFLKVLIGLAREKGFKCLAAEDGRSGLELAEKYKPGAIVLDVGLPKIDGWSVMERLKQNPETRHIPVQFMSGMEQQREAWRMGAIGYLLKPVGMAELTEAFRKIENFINSAARSLLILANTRETGEKIMQISGGKGVDAIIALTIEEAYSHLQEKHFDCLVVDLDAEFGRGLHFLENLQKDEALAQIPVIVYSARDPTPQENAFLQNCADRLTVKQVHSPERLLDETTLFLHQVAADLPKEKRTMLEMLHDKELLLKGKKVLIADDDTRNTFALLIALEEKGMEGMAAKNGKEALRLLEQHSDIHIVLMDIMMPEMDGYEAMQKIRAQDRYQRLPIIALTAKAMKGDKAKCIEAGANDYLSKPVDTDKLLSLMRVWLYR